MTINRDDPLLLLSGVRPLLSSSPVEVSDADGILSDTSQLESANSSFQNDSYLGGGCDNEGEYGSSRPDLRNASLAGMVEMYERHVFLCYKNPKVWPPRIEAAESDRLPRLLSAALTARKLDMKRQTRLTICEGDDGTATSNGDVLIFPDMVKYRRLTHFDVDTFVEEVLVKDTEWLPGSPERLRGWYIFVCCHGTRDRKCGISGPAIVSKFKDEIESHGLKKKVFVSPCSHFGGNKYVGNLIIFGANAKKEVTGHWYGHVMPEDVPILIEQHIGKGEIVDFLWRGQMGLSEDDQKKSQEQRLQLYGVPNKCTQETSKRTDATCASGNTCCRENGAISCCQNPIPQDNILDSDSTCPASNLSDEKQYNSSQNNSRQSGAKRRVFPMPKWYDFCGREDLYALISVAVAAVSVYAAYKCIKNQ